MKMFSLKKAFPAKKKFQNLDKDNVHEIKEYDDLLKLPIVACKISGVRLTCQDSFFVRVSCLTYFWTYFYTCFLAAMIECLSMVVELKNGNAQSLFLMMPCVGFILVAMAKSYNMVKCRPIFEKIISELREMWPRGTVSEEEHDIIFGMIKQLRLVMKGYFWCNIFLIVFFISSPLINYVKRLMGQDVALLLSFKYWVPFDQFQPVVYEIILMIQTSQTFIIVFFMLAADLLLFFFLGNITMQFEILALRIQHLIYVPVDKQLIAEYPLGIYNKDFDKKFDSQLPLITLEEWENIHLSEIQVLVVRHQALIRLAGSVEKMYTFSLLINFINSSILICFCGFCCVFVEKWNELIYKFFLTSAISQVWMLCWYGQRLLDSSEKVANALYSSGWYNASKKIRSSILIMLHRSQREVHITTYGFSVISLESFTTIIKTSWSYFTLLINTYHQE